jgi:hypothetical protein
MQYQNFQVLNPFHNLTTLGMGIGFKLSQPQKADAIFLKNLNFLRVVPSVLNFTDVACTKKKLTGTTL